MITDIKMKEGAKKCPQHMFTYMFMFWEQRTVRICVKCGKMWISKPVKEWNELLT